MTPAATTNVEAAVLDLLDQGVGPERIILFSDHPEFPGYLQVEPISTVARGLFYQSYKDWMSRHFVLNGLHLLDQFLLRLDEDDYRVIFSPTTQAMLDDHARWSAPLEIPGYQLRPFQQFCLNQALERARTGTDNTGRFYFLNWSAGAGKAAPLTEPVLTPIGWRTMGDLRPGDHVIGSDGNPTRVVAIHPQGVLPVHRVEMNDGTFVRCNSEHLWNVRKYSTRVRKSTRSAPTRKTRVEEAPWKTLTTAEIATNTGRRWQLPESPVVWFDGVDLEMDPYTLGVFLGDGCWPQNGTVSVSTDRKIIESLGLTPWSSMEARGHEYHTSATVPLAVREALRSLGLAHLPSSAKFVPEHFLRASPESRHALLQGLLDTDGSVDFRKSGVEYSSTSLQLTEAVADLVRGLGGKATISGPRTTRYADSTGVRKDGQPSWRVHLSLPADIEPFRLHRKSQRVVKATKYRPIKTITAVVDEGVSEEQVCITVAAEDGLYVTRGHAVTHNSFCSAAGAKALFDSDDIDLVLAFTLNDLLKENMRRSWIKDAGLRAVVNDHAKPAVRRDRYTFPGEQVFIMNYEKLWVDFEALSALTAGKRVLFVLDEGHKLIAEAGQNKARVALDKITRGCEATIWPMSATVVGGSPLRFRDVFSLDSYSRNNPLGSKEDFVARYADKVTTIQIRTKNGGQFPLTKYDWNLPKLHEVRHRVGDRTMAVRKTDPGIREQFKGIECLPEWVPMTNELSEIYDVILADAKECRDLGESRAPHYLAMRVASINPAALAFSDNEISQRVWAEHRELCVPRASNKIEMLNDRLDGIREGQDKAVVFCHWTNQGVVPLSRLLKVPYVLHYGDMTTKAKIAAQDQFKGDPDLTCFLSSDAGTHGLNMQEARYVISIDPLYSYDDLTQRNSRIDRADSHLDGLTAYVMITEGSKVEERIWQTCEARRRLAEAVQGTREELTYGEAAEVPESGNLDWLIGLES